MTPSFIASDVDGWLLVSTERFTLGWYAHVTAVTLAVTIFPLVSRRVRHDVRTVKRMYGSVRIATVFSHVDLPPGSVISAAISYIILCVKEKINFQIVFLRFD